MISSLMPQGQPCGCHKKTPGRSRLGDAPVLNQLDSTGQLDLASNSPSSGYDLYANAGVDPAYAGSQYSGDPRLKITTSAATTFDWHWLLIGALAAIVFFETLDSGGRRR